LGRHKILLGTISAVALAATLLIPEATLAADTGCRGRRATIAGDARDNFIRGTNGPDVIAAGSGDDTVLARRGEDLVCGGRGADEIHGGKGADRISGARGRDRLLGGDGFDDISGGDDADRLRGGTKPDVFDGGRGGDAVDGGLGIDTLVPLSPSGPLNVDLAAGTSHGEGSDTLADIENVILFRGVFDDTITGSNRPNLLLTGRGDDAVAGRGGDDLYLDDPGDDSFDGGAGSDEVSYVFSSRGVNADLSSGEVIGQGTDTISRTETFTGSFGNDTVTGTDADETFMGLEGGDDVSGRLGDDIFLGGQDGDDRYDGGGGSDLVSYSAFLSVTNLRDPLLVDLVAGTASSGGQLDRLSDIEGVEGSQQADEITGDGEPNDLLGAGGADVMKGATGDDRIFGDSGDDRLHGGNGSDLLYGGSGFDRCLDGEETLSCETDGAAAAGSRVPRPAAPYLERPGRAQVHQQTGSPLSILQRVGRTLVPDVDRASPTQFVPPAELEPKGTQATALVLEARYWLSS
jgi:Ca2+-binding RTX toxin-like protein